MQSGYVAALLYILALCFAKIAVLAFIRSTISLRKERKVVHALATIVCLWTFIGELGTAFICDLPRPWDYIAGKCINRVWAVISLIIKHPS